MTFLGKVFTFLTFFLSAVFFVVALAVSASHSKWRDAVVNEKTGYRTIEKNLRAGNTQLKEQVGQISNELAQEMAARKIVLAALQSELAAARDELSAKTAEYNTLQAAHTEQNQTLAATQKELSRISEENEKIGQQLTAAIEDRNAKQRRVATLTDTVNEQKVTLATLEKKKKDLIDSLTYSEARTFNYQNALKIAGIVENPDDAPPSDLKGVVLEVSKDGLVEISLGRDDGLKEGHTLEIYRGAQYLGRIEIKRTEDDKAIGQIVPGFKKGYIQRGDNVISKLG